MKSAILAKMAPKPISQADSQKTNEQKALDLAAQMVNESPQNALKMLAKEENEQKSAPEATSSLVKSPVASLQGDIISRTIALAKASKDKEEHPLGGALFGALNLNVQTGLENTAVPEKILAKLDSNST